MSQLETLSLIQTIEKIENLIDTGNGDTGRLYHILDFLKNNKPLYHSDQVYLETKLDSSFTVEEESKEENEFLPKIKELIDNGTGDPGRLQHIYDMVANNKPLYHSDVTYVESKLHPLMPVQITQTIELVSKQEIITPLQKEKPTSDEPQSNIHGSMPKGWDYVDSGELTQINETITNEEAKIEQQKKISDEIDLRRSELSVLISHRKEYEQKITHEKSSFESQIQDERLKIETQTRLSKDIISQKEELTKVKKERTNIIKKIASEKSKISSQLTQQKIQLVQAQLEQEKLEKQIQTEKTLLLKMTNEQKLRLTSQAKIAHDITSKQIELEKTKHDYDEIQSQIHEEKIKFTKSQKLKKSIKIQEQDLIKAKEERLNLINSISKEKESILQKTQEERKKLKSQTVLSKQLKKEEKILDALKKKHDKMEQQIKIKNQKLREKQEKLKKQINTKDKKLKSLAKKSPSKKITKKSSKKKTLKAKK